MSVEAGAAPAGEVVNPATPAAEPAVTTPAAEPTEAIQYSPTGDQGLDTALTFLAQAGIAADHPAVLAANEGDFGLLRLTLAQKGVPGWEQAVQLGQEAYDRLKGKEEANRGEVESTVLGVAEQMGLDWEAAIEWGRANASPEESKALNELFANPLTAKIGAHYLLSNFANASGLDQPPLRQAVAPDAVGTPAAAGPTGTLTRVEFAQEAGKLHKKFGEGYNQTPEYKALARRLQR